MRKKIGVLGEYLGHLAIGAGMFASLLFFSGVIHWMVHFAAPYINDGSFIALIERVEQAILYADAGFLVWWAAFSTYEAIKELHSDE